jgi:hypothetical protein
MTFSPVDRVCHAYIKHFFVFFPKKVADVTDFGPNSRKSLRKANSLLGYFRAFWFQSGIAVQLSWRRKFFTLIRDEPLKLMNFRSRKPQINMYDKMSTLTTSYNI